MSAPHRGDDLSPSNLTPLFDVPALPPLFPVEPELVVHDPPSLQDSLTGAALLWCVHLQWPPVRAIAACAGVTSSSVLWPFGTIEQMRQALVRSERAALAALLEEHGGDLSAAVDERVDQLCAHDPRLSTLPLLAALAAGVHDATELACLAGAVRSVPAG
jgi:hypothetical protein